MLTFALNSHYNNDNVGEESSTRHLVTYAFRRRLQMVLNVYVLTYVEANIQ